LEQSRGRRLTFDWKGHGREDEGQGDSQVGKHSEAEFEKFVACAWFDLEMLCVEVMLEKSTVSVLCFVGNSQERHEKIDHPSTACHGEVSASIALLHSWHVTMFVLDLRPVGS
jgi:hypothetical protein